MKLSYLGPSGTFSEQAAGWFADQLKVSKQARADAPSISDALAAVSGETVAVVPFYNLIDGLVTETPDRILQEGLRIFAALRLPIRIAVGHGSAVKEDGPVYSHPKALAQCSDYLSENHPQRQRLAVASTAEGVEQALAQGGIALASESALKARDATILIRDATNNYLGRTNYTEFVLVAREGSNFTLPEAPEQRCVIACDPQDDRPGLLAGMLSQLAFFNLNLARIHARPSKQVTPTELDPQIFFLEIAGSIAKKPAETLLESLSIGLSGNAVSKPVKLGDYPLYDISEG